MIHCLLYLWQITDLFQGSLKRVLKKSKYGKSSEDALMEMSGRVSSEGLSKSSSSDCRNFESWRKFSRQLKCDC